MADWWASTPRDDLARKHAGREAVGLGEAQALEDRARRLSDLPLIEGVQLQQAVGALDDLHPGNDARAP